MKKISLFLAIIMIVAGLSVTLHAIDRPYYKPSYLDTEGGMDFEQMYFGGMKGNIRLIVDYLFGENTFYNEMNRRSDELAASFGIDLSDPNYPPEDVLIAFYYECNRQFSKKEDSYEMIKTFNITKAQFIEANHNIPDEDKFTDEEIELLYGGDMNAILNHAKFPLAYVYGDEIFCFNEVLTLDYAKQYDMYKNGDFGEYLIEMQGKVTTEFDYDNLTDPYYIDLLSKQWLDYVSWRLASGEVPESSPQTGDSTWMLLSLAVASGVLAVAMKRRTVAR